MSFIWPSLLISLICVPLMFMFYWRIQQRRWALEARQNKVGLIRAAAGQSLGARRHIPALIFMTGLTLLLLSMARPQATVSLPRIEGTVILTFDVSGSMSAEDIEPTRMEAAKAAALDFVEKQPSGVLVGVVAFSDGGISVQAPTNNRAETTATIERLVPRRGTSVGNGILVALNSIAVSAGDAPILSNPNLSAGETPTPVTTPQGWYTSAVIVLLSDGENNQNPDPASATDLAADLGVRIYTVGLGTPGGADITVEGFKVHSQLDEAVLQAIAETSGGQYYNASNAEDLRRIYNDLEPKLAIKEEEMEITSILAGIGIVVFLIGGAISMLWFGHVP